MNNILSVSLFNLSFLYSTTITELNFYEYDTSSFDIRIGIVLLLFGLSLKLKNN